jgi:FKBP-type peptidyl-prolyl cis-trans isomerase SlyD
MKICKGTVVGIDYTLKDNDGNLIDKSDESRPLVYLQGYGNIIPGLEAAMDGKTEGETIEVRVEPEQGYGVSRPEMIQVVPKDRFEGLDGEIEMGMQFNARTDQGAVITVRVVKVEGDEVTIDGNHPLADVVLNFVVTVREIRLATGEELEHGHPHVAGGCCGGHGEEECCHGEEDGESCGHGNGGCGCSD